MKKSNVLLFALFLGGAMGIYGCSGKNSETDGEGTGAINIDADEKASPLRSEEGKIGDIEVKIQYGSPSVKNRVIWGDLLPYNEVWRTGANEATFVEFSDDVIVEGKALTAGKYSLFTVPKENGPWTVIFNTEWDLDHGHYQYREENDALRVEVDPQWEEEIHESLSITIENSGLLIAWEKLRLPIQVQ